MGCTIDDTLLHILLLTRHLDRENIPAAILAILIELGFSPQSDGFGYLRDAVFLRYQNRNRRMSVIYSMIGESNDPLVEWRQVEQTIRNTIAAGWKYGSKLEWDYFFPPSRYGKNMPPSNGDFIAMMACILELWQSCSKEAVYATK